MTTTNKRSETDDTIHSNHHPAAPRSRKTPAVVHPRDYAILWGTARQHARRVLEQWMMTKTREDAAAAVDERDPVVVVVLLGHSFPLSLVPSSPVDTSSSSSYSSLLSPNQWFDRMVQPYHAALQRLFFVTPPRRYQVLDMVEEIVQAVNAVGVQFCWPDTATFVPRPVVVHALTAQWMRTMAGRPLGGDTTAARTKTIWPPTFSPPPRIVSRVIYPVTLRRRSSLRLAAQQTASSHVPPMTRFLGGELSHNLLESLKVPSSSFGTMKTLSRNQKAGHTSFSMIDSLVEDVVVDDMALLTEDPNLDTDDISLSLGDVQEEQVDLEALYRALVDSTKPKRKKKKKNKTLPNKRPKYSHKKIPAHERVYVQVTEQDVCGGRVDHRHPHCGNVQFRKWAHELMPVYVSNPVRQRGHVAEELMNRVYRSGGRFLHKDEDGWFESHPAAARAKCSQSFRHLYNKSQNRPQERKKVVAKKG